MTSPSRCTIDNVPRPEPGDGQVLVRIEACGLCHTDIHAAHGDWPIKPPLPLIPGHEGVGIVEALGPGAGEEIVQLVGEKISTGPGYSLMDLIPTVGTHDTMAHRRRVMDAILAGAARRSVQALQQASTMAS